jgi:hypothetical protein
MTKRRGNTEANNADETRLLLDEILTDAYGEDEQLWALRQAFDDGVAWPSDAFVIGEPVTISDVGYDGNVRRGLVATCRRGDSEEYSVAVSEVRFTPGTDGARHVDAYRMWLGLEPAPASQPAAPRRSRHHKATGEDLDLSRPVELITLAVKEKAARCRIPGTSREITLRSRDIWNIVPGEILTVRARKQWRFSGHPYLSGDIESSRVDVSALGLTPLRLESVGTWDPATQYWGEEGEPLEEWAVPIVERGPRPKFEMEQVLPGLDPDDPFDDPIVEASELQEGGDMIAADRILMGLLAEDLRCLDAHAHLGNFAFGHRPKKAIRHYEMGIRIGELSLDDDFDGVLAWGFIDNRPFMRCLHGYGLCLWRLGRDDEALGVFERMLWLNPMDNQGIRFLRSQLRDGEKWDNRNGDR